MTNTNQDLSQRIEEMVREHISATHRAAQEALRRAFGSAARTPASAPRRVTSSSSPSRKRRPAAELASLGERFFRAVCAKPGEMMIVLAAEVGALLRELYRAVTLLKQAGRVRSVGSRHQTRYFPLANGSAASA